MMTESEKWHPGAVQILTRVKSLKHDLCGTNLNRIYYILYIPHDFTTP